MRVQIERAAELDRLVDFLLDGGATVRRLSAKELEVSLVGSYDVDAMRMELYLRLRAWEEARSADGARVEIVD